MPDPEIFSDLLIESEDNRFEREIADLKSNKDQRKKKKRKQRKTKKK